MGTCKKRREDKAATKVLSKKNSTKSDTKPLSKKNSEVAAVKPLSRKQSDRIKNIDKVVYNEEEA